MQQEHRNVNLLTLYLSFLRWVCVIEDPFSSFFSQIAKGVNLNTALFSTNMTSDLQLNLSKSLINL